MIIIETFTKLIDFILTIITFLPDRLNVIIGPFFVIYSVLLIYKFKN